MSNGTNFKLYDPVAQLIAAGPGGGGGLPLTGGTLTGNLTLSAPAKVIQSQAPVNPTDVVNKAYVDGLVGGGPFLPLSGGAMTGAITQPLAPVAANDVVNKAYVDGAFQAKKPSAVSGNIAVFGSGGDVGQTIDSGFSVDVNLSNPPSNTTLWPSSRLIGALQYGANVYKATASIIINSGNNDRAFSTGNTFVGPASWPNLGSTFSLAPTGIMSISNSLEYTTYFLVTFVGCNINSGIPNSVVGTIQCQFVDESGPTPIGVLKNLNCLAGPAPAFCNEVYLSALLAINPSTTFNFSVRLTNPGANSITVDFNSPSDPCLLTVQRVA